LTLHLSFHVVLAIERYSASTEEDWDIICCFLVFQDIGERPKKITQPVRECLVRGQAAESASHYPYNLRSQSLPKKIPCPGFSFRYHTTSKAAVWQLRLGEAKINKVANESVIHVWIVKQNFTLARLSLHWKVNMTFILKQIFYAKETLILKRKV